MGHLHIELATAWKNNGDDMNPHYDFVPKRTWSPATVDAVLAEIVEKIETSVLEANIPPSDKWLDVLRMAPLELRKTVLFEVKNGNRINSIAKSGWPDAKSVVVNLKIRFHKQSRINKPPIQWRLLNDPHYCLEEIIYENDGATYLIIA